MRLQQTEIILRTRRMFLRTIRTNDVEDLINIFSDPETMRFYPSTKDRMETEEWIAGNSQRYQTDGFGMWTAVLRNSGDFAGICGLVTQDVENRKEVEIGYLFLRKFWGQGLATEAAAACRDYGFRIGYSQLISLIDPENIASRRVAEKNGMTRERTVLMWGKELCLYSINSAKII